MNKSRPPFFATDKSEGSLVRKFAWGSLAVLVVVPILWLPAAFCTLLIWFRFSLKAPLNEEAQLIVLMALLVLAVAAAYVVVRHGLERGWPNRRVQLWGWSIAASAMVATLVTTVAFFRWSMQLAEDKAVISNLRQISVAVDQYFEENRDRSSVTYGDIIGPSRYLKNVNPVVGEDYHSLFPVGRHQPGGLTMRLPQGRTVKFDRPPQSSRGPQNGEMEHARP